MDFDGCIYLISHKESKKRYVGQHNQPDPNHRWQEHIWKANKGSKFAFHNALRKYGADAFTWEVLCICPVDRLTEMEGYYAEVFETYVWDTPGGYNMVWCSASPTLGITQSPEHIEKRRQANLGKKISLETRERMRQAQLGKKKSPEAIEKTRQAVLNRSPETRERMRQAQLGRKMSPEAIEKTRQAVLNRSPETRENIRQAMLAYWATRRANTGALLI
jgi:group I intron endonuclease